MLDAYLSYIGPSARIEPELELCGYLVNKKGEKEFSYRSSLHQFLFEPTQKQSMSEEEEEILELNAEGEFIVPTSKAPKNFDAVNVPVAKAPAAAEKKKINKALNKSSSSSSTDVLSLIASGEYKIYSYETESKLDVIVRLETAAETVKSVNVTADKVLVVESSSGARLVVDLADVQADETTQGASGNALPLDAAHAQACNFEDYVVVSFSP